MQYRPRQLARSGQADVVSKLLAVMKVKVVVQVWRVRLVWVDHHVVLPVRHVSSVQLSENQCVVAVVAATVVGARMNVRREECLLVAPRLARERIFQAEHLEVSLDGAV
eukprot:CAMPEP_0119545082 /NCGR_PEP_ID=MMETSP1344-20130328/55060_1 /TAXON_ID=236787 /ORGANISM="Florenciella parvula, Strain CCMP2471" /LENGTH=108 /DNA_ID=CAMNT_0007589595 /DNA_START=603 /DNA_END=929 /DNA_ORIENTATION=-